MVNNMFLRFMSSVPARQSMALVQRGNIQVQGSCASCRRFPRVSLWHLCSAGTFKFKVPALHVVGSRASVYGTCAAREPLTRFGLYKINNEEWGA